jgi:hypothetical protein
MPKAPVIPKPRQSPDLRVELKDLEGKLGITTDWQGSDDLLPARVEHLRKRVEALKGTESPVAMTPSGEIIFPCHGQINLAEINNRWAM